MLIRENAFVYSHKFSYAYIKFSSEFTLLMQMKSHNTICIFPIMVDQMAYNHFGFATKLNSQKIVAFASLDVINYCKRNVKIQNSFVVFTFVLNFSVKYSPWWPFHTFAAWFDDYITFLLCLRAIYSDFVCVDLAKNHKLYKLPSRFVISDHFHQTHQRARHLLISQMNKNV